MTPLFSIIGIKHLEKESFAVNRNTKELRAQLAAFWGNNDFSVEPFAAGASVRRYYLIRFKKNFYFPEKEIVLMRIPADKPEVADDYFHISYYLRRCGIPQPLLYEMHREKGWIFLSRAKGEQLDVYLHKHPHEIETIYPRLLEFLVEMQKKAVYEAHCPAFQRFFDAEKYLYEFQFHVKEQLLGHHFQYQMSGEDERLFGEFAEEISRFLGSRKKIFVHRDFQSSNIFYHKNNPKEPFQLIDFQDARSGSPVYDLISLLWDSYVIIPTGLREQWVDWFYENGPWLNKNFSYRKYLKMVDYTVIQRKLHDAGAFVLTHRLLNNNAFLSYIDPAVEMALIKIRKYPTFAKIALILEKLLGDKYVKNDHH